ncbi:MAG: UPF0147 family protein [Candidatus Marsarchaeota archaeon]|jgi:uncharacterized protein (UPF0147 family)|nr:UPF0147 family protein [Candidatus Marsarchaeota archaeon]MCL5418879.1 UPF0147 family protein [Candidatus Marsarchaeota archaeon]
MKDEKKVAELLAEITRQMDALLNDTSVPKNVRGTVGEARQKLNSNADFIIKVSEAIYNLDSVSNDINLPPQARTTIWNILSMLESIKTS